MSSETESSENKAEVGLVSRWLPWHWSSTPRSVQAVIVVAADVVARVKEFHPVCASALGTAEDGARRASNITMGLADKAAKVVDKRLELLIVDSRKGLSGMEEYAFKQWSRIKDLHSTTIANVEKTTGFQLGLQLADSMLSIMDSWTQSYQEYLRITRRWIRHSRRRGNTNTSDNRRISSRKRGKFVNRFWSFLTTSYVTDYFRENDRKRKVDAMYSASEDSDTDYNSNSDASTPKSNDLKTKLEEIRSASESSFDDPDYHSEDSSSTDSLEYNSGEEGDPEIPENDENTSCLQEDAKDPCN